MILFYSGSSYTKCHPERVPSLRGLISTMQTYWEIKHRTAKEHVRFKKMARRRRKG